MNTLFVTCASSLENLLAEELIELGYPDVQVGYRGVTVKINQLSDIYLINYCTRIGERVLYPLLKFQCRNKEQLYKEASKINWLNYLKEKQTFAIDANVHHHPNFRNSLFAAQVLKDAICDQFREKKGSRPNVDTYAPDVQLNLYMQSSNTILSLDTSLKPLHKRGYRIEGGEAPMRETLAAACLRLARYQGNEKLCDPCCGSGTFLIEAALMASKIAPGFLRKQWGFTSLPEFSHMEWLKVKNEVDSQRKDLQKGFFLGIDKSKEAVRICKANLRACGLHPFVQVENDDFRESNLTFAPNFVITNPPYGKRLEDLSSLAALYRSLGDFMKRQMECPGKGFIFTGSFELSKEVGLAAKRRIVLDNGGVESRLLEYEIY